MASGDMDMDGLDNTTKNKTTPQEERHNNRNCWQKFIDKIGGYLNLLLLAIPIAIILRICKSNEIAQFVFSALGIVPLAGIMGNATEAIADRMGPGVGAILNAAFGNAAEIIIGLFALFRDLDSLVKASLVGSIIGNQMLVLGASMLIGGMKYSMINFNATAAGQVSALAVCSAIAILIPAIFHAIDRNVGDKNEHKLSLAVCIILMLTYFSSLVFQLVTHKGEVEAAAKAATLYKDKLKRLKDGEKEEEPPLPKVEDAPERIVKQKTRTRTMVGLMPVKIESNGDRSLVRVPEESSSRNGEEEDEEEEPIELRKAMIMLVCATAVVAGLSEILTGAVETFSKDLGLPEVFVGVIIVAIVGNAAEHSSAVMMALKDKFDVAIGISFGSSLQISMFAMPLLVFCSYARKSGPMDLLLTEFEIVAVVVASALAWMLVGDGATYWMEGVMLLMVYLCLAVGFFFLPVE